jgi:CheY-like chemotaxis protein
MVDRGEIEAWRTTGGHRRLSRASVMAHLQRIKGATQTTRSAEKGPVRVMVLDDDRITQSILVDYLHQRFPEVDVVQALDGYEGLIKAGQGAFDLIFVDLHMPKMDGYAAIDAIQSLESSRTTNIVVITADQPEQVDMERLGKHRVVLTKPLPLDVIGQFICYEKALKGARVF